MQKIFVIRHMPRESEGDFDQLVSFVRNELYDEGVEVYSSLEEAAYMTAFRLTTRRDYLRDKFIFPKDNQFSGIVPYKFSHIENLSPFPLFELTGVIKKEEICKTAASLFQSQRGDNIQIDINEMALEEALVQYSCKSSLLPLVEIVGRTANNILLVTHGGVIEYVQREWGFPKMEGEPAYLSGSIIIPSISLCREFGPVTRYEIKNEVQKEV